MNWEKHRDDINKKPSNQQLDMIEAVNTELKLSDGSRIEYIGGIYGLNGDFFLMFPTGEVKLLLNFKLKISRKKKWVEIDRFMLVDEGYRKNHSGWRLRHKEFRLDTKSKCKGQIYDRI